MIDKYEESETEFTGQPKDHVTSLVEEECVKRRDKSIAELRGLKKQEVCDEFHK